MPILSSSAPRSSPYPSALTPLGALLRNICQPSRMLDDFWTYFSRLPPEREGGPQQIDQKNNRGPTGCQRPRTRHECHPRQQWEVHSQGPPPPWTPTIVNHQACASQDPLTSAFDSCYRSTPANVRSTWVQTKVLYSVPTAYDTRLARPHPTHQSPFHLPCHAGSAQFATHARTAAAAPTLLPIGLDEAASRPDEAECDSSQFHHPQPRPLMMILVSAL